ncbi:MAG: type II toxin-antitoxin system HicA family toxin [Candidatus Brocadiia bacterium]|jgi:predicted RNA binding protein YcfA (HicA-like mRNA interferase family)
MDRLPALSSREVIAVLRRSGCVDAPRRGKGSHRAFVRRTPDGIIRLVIVPQSASLPRGTLRAILRQAGFSVEEFGAMLRK